MFRKNEQEMNTENTFQDISIYNVYLLPLKERRNCLYKRHLRARVWEPRPCEGVRGSRTCGWWCFASVRDSDPPASLFHIIYRNTMGTRADASPEAGKELTFTFMWGSAECLKFPNLARLSQTTSIKEKYSKRNCTLLLELDHRMPPILQIVSARLFFLGVASTPDCNEKFPWSVKYYCPHCFSAALLGCYARWFQISMYMWLIINPTFHWTRSEMWKVDVSLKLNILL